MLRAMTLRNLAALLRNRWARPDKSPTVLSLFAAGIVLAILLALPDRPSDRMATAAEVQRVVVTPAKPRRPISLRDRLVVGLQARTESEVEFVEDVALRVRLGQLPQRMVDQTFFWARKRAAVVRNGRTRRPIIYFRPAMAVRADRLGVEL